MKNFRLPIALCLCHPTPRIPNSYYSLVRPSQKVSSGDISGTKRGIIDQLVSKRPETNSEKRNPRNFKIPPKEIKKSSLKSKKLKTNFE